MSWHFLDPTMSWHLSPSALTVRNCQEKQEVGFPERTAFAVRGNAKAFRSWVAGEARLVAEASYPPRRARWGARGGLSWRRYDEYSLAAATGRALEIHT